MILNLSMKKLTILLFSILISFNSFGELTEIGYTDAGNTFYIDNNTIKEHGGHVYAWTMRNYLEPSPEGVLSTKIYRKVDCYVNREMILSFVAYDQSMGIGKTLTTYTPPKEWDYPSPGTVGANSLKYICGYVD